MSHRRPPCCRIILALSFLIAAHNASSEDRLLNVDCAASQLVHSSGRTELHLALLGDAVAGSTISGLVEVLDHHDFVLASHELDGVELGAGGRLVCPLHEIDELEPRHREDLLWSRIHYRLVASDRNGQRSTEGVLATELIAPSAFILEIVAPETTSSGSIPVRVLARELRSQAPLTGVEVTLRGAGSDTPDAHTAVTGEDGRAALEIEMEPQGWDPVEIEVTGTMPPFVQTHTLEVFGLQDLELVLATDKPLYRPGETIHFRAVAMSEQRGPVAAAELLFELHDGDNALVFKEQRPTSEFGIAAAGWTIPDDAVPGEYELDVRLAGAAGHVRQHVELKVSRYELPTFMVAVATDRPFYLAGEDAEVTLAATTMAGQPIVGAEVEVFDVGLGQPWLWWQHENHRDGAMHRAGRCSTDAAGRCSIRVDHARIHRGLTQNLYYKMLDRAFIARVTEPATRRNRTRQFTLRATKQPLHVYVSAQHQEAGLPVTLFITTFSADGLPVPCQVELRAEQTGDELALTTDSHGVARVVLPAAHHQSRLDFVATAVDAEGRRGTCEEWIYLSETPGVRLLPRRLFYAAGEPLQLELQSSISDADAVVEAYHAGRLVGRATTTLTGFPQPLELPVNEVPPGSLVTLEATIDPTTWRGPPETIGCNERIVPAGSATVLFPDPEPLTLDVEVEPAQARPGDEVTLRFTTGSSARTRAALGIAVVDEAVEELLAERGQPDGVSFFTNRSRQLGAFASTTDFAGVGIADLMQVDPHQVPEELANVAALLLAGSTSSKSVYGTDFEATRRRLYHNWCHDRIAPLVEAVEAFQRQRGHYPHSWDAVRPALEEKRVSPTTFLDPWHRPFSWQHRLQGVREGLALQSAGPDGVTGNDDDIDVGVTSWPWFQPVGDRLVPIVMREHAETGSWPTSAEQLRHLLERSGIGSTELTDPWGSPLLLEVETHVDELLLTVQSAGPDHVFTPESRVADDDLVVRAESIATFQPTAAQIEDALDELQHRGLPFPASMDELEPVLAAVGMGVEALQDPDGDRYVLRFDEEPAWLWNTYRIMQEAQTLTPLWQPRLRVIRVLPAQGQERDDSSPVHVFRSWPFEGTEDRPGASELLEEAHQAAVNAATTGSSNQGRGATGAELGSDRPAGGIVGRITAGSGIPLPGATVRISPAGITEEVISDVHGRFALTLEPGDYELEASLSGFTTALVVLSVRAGTITEVDISLSFGLTECLVVTSRSPVLNSTEPRADSDAGRRGRPMQTPRLRRDFPETLLWLPELETGPDGRATVPLRLADSVTTWKVQAVATTLAGRYAEAMAEVAASLPFYAELDLPPVLTAGDLVHLPVVLRNFTDTEQEVDVEAVVGNSLQLNADSKTRVRMAPRDSTTVTFPVRATTAVAETTFQARARATTGSDAVERGLRIRPFAEQVRVAANAAFRSEAELGIAAPEQALAGSATARLRVVGDLGAHLAEGMQGIMHRPIGCAEQITSGAWVSLLLLENAVCAAGPVAGETCKQARLNLTTALEKLTSLARPDGGISYWRRGRSDLVLTAHVARFLGHARASMEVQESLLDGAVTYLLQRQQRDGGWPAAPWQGAEDLLLTDAFVARCLSELPASNPATRAAVERALGRLEPLLRGSSDAQTLAYYVMACHNLGKTKETQWAVHRLAELAERRPTMARWRGATFTPLSGWGLPARVEATAVALQALAEAADGAHQDLVDGAVLYLLHTKDAESTWYSTTATAAAFEAMTTAGLGEGRAGGSLEVIVGGQHVAELALPAGGGVRPAVWIDLPERVATGIPVLLKRTGGSSLTSAELVVEHLLPWPSEAVTSARIPDLAFAVTFDTHQVRVGEPITCLVRAARTSTRGNGMLLAEVGLPPGAQVDTVVLDASMNWRSSYELEPDRLVLYLWPLEDRPEEIRFTITPRFAGTSVSAPSRLSDYYNPDAQVVLPPQRFTVTDDRAYSQEVRRSAPATGEILMGTSSTVRISAASNRLFRELAERIQ